MNEKILFVDDDQNILAAYRRQFHNQFQLETAPSGQAGLDLLSQGDKIALVIADFRMPGMDGLEFLRRAKALAPDSIRMMLTGYAELNQAIEAVNEGSIFRFLTKPCPPETLLQALQAGLDQYRLVHAEKELLEKTLSNSIRILTEVLSLANPTAYSEMLRLRKIVHTISYNLQEARRDGWMYELSAMLALIGCVALPQELLEKTAQNEPLTITEQKWYASHPMIGFKFLEPIPRLGAIALMVRDQHKDFHDFQQVKPSRTVIRQAELGAQILKVAQDYSTLIRQGYLHQQAVEIMSTYIRKYNPEVVKALGQEEILGKEYIAQRIEVKDAVLGMIANEDIYAKDGTLVVSKSQEFSLPVVERLNLLCQSIGIFEPFLVLVPEGRQNKEPTSADPPVNSYFQP